MSATRVLLANDYPVVGIGMRSLVRDNPDLEIVGETTEPHETLCAVQALCPDVLVINFARPEASEADWINLLHEQCPELPVLVLAARQDAEAVQQVLRAGASGYLVKWMTTIEELIQAIRLIARGGVYLTPPLSHQAIGALLEVPAQAIKGSSLSEREGAVLRRVAAGYSNKEIASQLGISVKTVETHKSRSMEKLNLHSRVEIIRHALRQGWLADRC